MQIFNNQNTTQLIHLMKDHTLFLTIRYHSICYHILNVYYFYFSLKLKIFEEYKVILVLENLVWTTSELLKWNRILNGNFYGNIKWKNSGHLTLRNDHNTQHHHRQFISLNLPSRRQSTKLDNLTKSWPNSSRLGKNWPNLKLNFTQILYDEQNIICKEKQVWKLKII